MSVLDSLIIFGAQYLYLVVVTATLVYIWHQPKELRWKILLCTVVALPLTYVVAKLLSRVYYDPRPFVVGHFTPLLPHAADNGFPSDHTLLSSALAWVTYFFNRKWGLILLCTAIVVGLARVYVGIHHFVDIVGSVAIAFAVTFLVWRYFLSVLEETPWFEKIISSK